PELDLSRLGGLVSLAFGFSFLVLGLLGLLGLGLFLLLAGILGVAILLLVRALALVPLGRQRLERGLAVRVVTALGLGPLVVPLDIDPRVVVLLVTEEDHELVFALGPKGLALGLRAVLRGGLGRQILETPSLAVRRRVYTHVLS